jgi:hypothetical protein
MRRASATTSFARAAIGTVCSIALMRLLAAVCIGSVVACIPPERELSVGSGAGSPDGGETGAPPDEFCLGTGPLRFCLASAPTMPQENLTSIDTDTTPLCARVTHGDPFPCVVAATTLSIQSSLRATGLRPLVLLASESITIAPTGSIDVGSHSSPAPELGAGHDSSLCDPPASAPTDENFTSGGGAGGSFATAGASGGNGFGYGGAGGSGGVAAQGVPISGLRGGCAGQGGGGDTGGAGGHGGGAVFLVARTQIDVRGPINAGGEGGKGGDITTGAVTTLASGGGGGGAGGMIAFDAPMITSSGDPLIRADGGGGGAAAGTDDGGKPGSDSYQLSVAAPGGSGKTVLGGGGGAGSLGGLGMGGAKSGLTGSGSGLPGEAGGGGGGGGGAGVIVVTTNPNLGKNVSPTWKLMPMSPP